MTDKGGVDIVFERYVDDVALYCPEKNSWAVRLLKELTPDYDQQALVMEDIRSLYWTSDIPTTEIRDAYMPGQHLNAVPMVAGCVKLNRTCAVCGAQLFVSSRGRLIEIKRTPSCNDRCDPCVQAHRSKPETIALFAKVDAEMRVKYPHLYDQPPKPGPMPYQDYLQTDWWKSRRADSLRRAGYSCQVCSAKGELHVHHRTYARRGQELDADLIVLCAGCHGLFHANGKLASSSD